MLVPNLPPDLSLAIFVMSAVCLSVGVLVGWIASSNPSQRNVIFLACSVLASVTFQFYGSGQLQWARWVPLSAAIIYTNIASVLAASAAGWAYGTPQTPRKRRIMLAAGLGLISLTMILWPLLSMLLRPPPKGGNQWVDGVAMQTSWATCSPAAAATLLRAEGIDVSEADMIPRCLTDSAGTPTLGLYRGIHVTAEAHHRWVEITTESVEDLLTNNDWPILLAVELPFGVEDRRYVDQWGWIPGMGHSVVALGRSADNRILIGEPSVGLESWSEDDLRVLWHGDGIRIRE